MAVDGRAVSAALGAFMRDQGIKPADVAARLGRHRTFVEKRLRLAEGLPVTAEMIEVAADLADVPLPAALRDMAANAQAYIAHSLGSGKTGTASRIIEQLARDAEGTGAQDAADESPGEHDQ